MDDQSGWCTIESDPGVFTELVETLGVRGVEFKEVIGLDEDSLGQMGEVLGLVSLFKYRGENHKKQSMDSSPDNVFFAKQVIDNACATQAILSVLLNLKADQIELGDELGQFKEFTRGLDDESRGYAIGNSDTMRSAHNSFKPNISLDVTLESESDGEAFHYVSYVWVDGQVYELDGLQSGPIVVGECKERQHWLSVVVPWHQARIGEFQSAGGTELRFNLMAIVRDRREELRQILSLNPADSTSAAELGEIEYRRSVWAIENRRRRHDFMPLALQCMQILAESKSLTRQLTLARDFNK